MAAYMVDALIDEQVQKLQDDPRELRRYKDFSLYADLLPFIPTNIKAFVQSQLGIDRDFTELDLTNKEAEKLNDVLTEYWDEGPCHEGWQSSELGALSAKVATAIELAEFNENLDYIDIINAR